MSKNLIQFQIGLSWPEFEKLYSEEESCQKAVYKYKWPQGYFCDKCSHQEAYSYKRKSRKMYQCKKCGHQCSLLSGTLFERTLLPLSYWFKAFYLISQAKNSVSILELHRHLGVNYKSAWLMKHKIMQMMYDRDKDYKLKGRIEIDDAYLGGVLKGGSAGRGSENKAPFIAAIQTNDEKHPIYARFTPVRTFSKVEIKKWAEENISQGAQTVTDGLKCFNVLDDFGTHEVYVISKEGHKKTDKHFKWVNTVLSNIKTSLSGTFHSIDFKKYGFRYLADLQFRFNRRFDLSKLFNSLIRNSVNHSPCIRDNIQTALAG